MRGIIIIDGLSTNITQLWEFLEIRWAYAQSDLLRPRIVQFQKPIPKGGIFLDWLISVSWCSQGKQLRRSSIKSFALDRSTPNHPRHIWKQFRGCGGEKRKEKKSIDFSQRSETPYHFLEKNTY